MKVQERCVDYEALNQPTELRPLGEVIKPTRPRVKPSEKPHLPFIGMEHVEAHTMRLLGTVPASTMKSSAVHFQPGDVLYGRLRPYLNKVYRPDFEGLCSAEFIVFPKTESLDSRYLQYFLNSAEFVSFAAHLNAGDRPRVDFDQLAPYPFPVAPLDQQKRIVAEIEKQFSRLDMAVENLKRVKANLKRYKAAVLKAAVEGRLVELEAELARRQGKKYETGEELLQRILETRRQQWLARADKAGGTGRGKYKEPAAPDVSNLPELPEGWGWATMPQLGELNRGKSKHRPRDDKKLYGGPYPFIQTGDVRKSQGTITGYNQTYSEFGLKQSRLWPAGTLCITIAANIAETGILKLAACFPDSVVGFLIENGETTTQYVEYFIRTAREKLERFAPATAQKNINLEVLEAVAVPLPPLAEQLRIVAEVDRRLSLVRETEAQVDSNLRRAERLRQSILARAFSEEGYLKWP